MPRQTDAWRVALTAICPEISLGLMLLDAARARVRSDDSERGEAVPWVIIVAISAAIAITAGTIIYNKVTGKAHSITTDTPAPGQ